jgi:hypothetical protein
MQNGGGTQYSTLSHKIQQKKIKKSLPKRLQDREACDIIYLSSSGKEQDMKSQMEEIARLAKKAQECKEEYEAKRQELIAQALPYDEFLSKSRSLMNGELGSYNFYLKEIALWAELAFAEA